MLLFYNIMSISPIQRVSSGDDEGAMHITIVVLAPIQRIVNDGGGVR